MIDKNTIEEQLETAAATYASKRSTIEEISLSVCGFIDGAEWAIEQLQPKWYSLQEKLPNEGGPVLGIMKDTLDIYVCWYKISRKLFIVYGAGADPISDMKVTHWMPLPKPPKEY